MGQYDTASSAMANGATDEIDLMDLFAILWEGCWIILGLTVVAMVAGFVVIQQMPSIYRVEATLAGPSTYKMQVLQPSVLQKTSKQNARSGESGDSEGYGADYQVAPVEPFSVYIAGLAEVNSLSLKRQYWNAEGRELAGEEFGTAGDGSGLRAFAKSLQLTQPQQIRDVDTLAQLSFFTEDPEAGVEVLARYLAFAEGQIMSRQIAQLRLGLQSSLARLNDDYASMVVEERLRLEDELIRLQEAHEVAEALGINELASEKIENVWISLLDDRLYLLGAAVLGQEISALQARAEKPLEAFVPRLREMGQWRQQITRDLQRLDAAEGKVGAFNIVTPPEASLAPVKPNKPLLLIAVAFAAFILSVFLVLFRHGWRSYQARTAPVE